MNDIDLFGSIGEENMKRRQEKSKGGKVMILIDLTVEMVEFLETVRSKYSFRSRAETIRFALRRFSEMAGGMSQIEALESPQERMEATQKEIQSHWPVVRTKDGWVCPLCEGGNHCHGVDEIKPDAFNKPGKERMIHYVCMCPKCGPFRREQVAQEKPEAGPGAAPASQASPAPQPEPGFYVEPKSHSEVTIAEGNLHSGTLRQFYDYAGLHASPRDQKAALKRLERILTKNLKFTSSKNDKGEWVYTRPVEGAKPVTVAGSWGGGDENEGLD